MLLPPPRPDCPTRRIGDCIVWRHAALQSEKQAVLCHAVPTCGVRDDHLFAPNHDPTVLSGVTRLLLFRGPVAIVLAVVSIVVSAFKARPLRSLSHVRKERLKISIPLLGNADAPSAIPMKIRSFGFSTATAHVNPYPVFSGICSSMRSVSLFKRSPSMFTACAAAGVNFPLKKVIRPNPLASGPARTTY